MLYITSYKSYNIQHTMFMCSVLITYNIKHTNRYKLSSCHQRASDLMKIGCSTVTPGDPATDTVILCDTM